MSRLARVVRAGLVAALVVALGGFALEWSRFGGTDESALARVEADLRQEFDTSTATLTALAATVANQRDAIRAAPRDAASLKRLFDAVDAALPDNETGRTGITIYDTAAAPLAWGGRVSELPRERIDGPATLFVAPGALGPRLIRVAPVTDAARPGTRIATVVVEHTLAPDSRAPAMTDRFVVPTALAPVALRVRINGLPPVRTAFTFIIQSQSGEPLVDAEVSREDLVAARAAWRRATWAAALVVLVLTFLLAAGPLVELKRRAPAPRAALVATAGIVAALVTARLLLWTAVTLVAGRRPMTSPIDLLPTVLLAAVLVWMVLDLIERRRYVQPRARVLTMTPQSAGLVTAVYLVAGLLDAALLWTYELFLQAVTARTNLDLLHFSLHPISSPRLAMAFSLVLLHTAVIWAAAAITRAPTLRWRTPHGVLTSLMFLAWTSGALIGVLVVRPAGASIPPLPLLLALAAAGAAAASLAHIRVHARRTSQAARLAAVFMALLVPTLSMYPSLLALATQAKEHLVATDYGPQAMRQRDDLKARLQRTLEQLDALPALRDAVTEPSDVDNPATDRAFVVWSQTDLEQYRLTSAIELYRPDGRLLSRFALHLSEYVTARYNPASCDWDLSDEVSPVGSSERHVLRASRAICARGGRVLGGIVVRVMLDYSILPFVSAQSPYLESLRPDRQVPIEGVSGRDIEFAAYGWSRVPLYVSGTSAWTLSGATFQQTVESREPFWTTLDRDDGTFRVYIQSDRGGIYALGYPVITGFGHLMNLAELVILAGVACVLLVAGATLFHALALRTPTGGRALLREIRSSFYRKLFLAFLMVAIVPVLFLAVLARQYFASQAQAGVEDSAARTATVAQRLVEDYATLQQQQRGSAAPETLDDQIMFLVSRALDDDVNLFNRSRLQATSERDLYASQLLPTRTPGDVYRRILLERAPTYVSLQQLGAISYYLAAAPVRSGGAEDIVTVPLSLRQPEVERQIDELDRRVWLGIVLFSLFGAAAGYWRAERIADPVNRLARATRRIARGDLDARTVATSSDELGRLVVDFNRMAADLQRQRTELERTQRLEAWADMARQVAHDIKNPLTPIQLSAEHARRVNIDRGRPLSPALDDCVTAILSQVTLLRQIASEFSSFAMSPTPRPEPSQVASLIDEVILPYRTGLADRIAIDVDTQPDLPTLTLDRTLFSRALTNVVENALHAMPGKGRLTITSRQSPVASHQSAVVIDVTDTGVGMDQEALAKIFEPYFSTKATGTGLGLTIAKRNVELNKGTIAVTSRRGVGTTVTIVLPER